MPARELIETVTRLEPEYSDLQLVFAALTG